MKSSLKVLFIEKLEEFGHLLAHSFDRRGQSELISFTPLLHCQHSEAGVKKKNDLLIRITKSTVCHNKQKRMTRTKPSFGSYKTLIPSNIYAD